MDKTSTLASTRKDLRAGDGKTQLENWCWMAELVSEKSSPCEVGWMRKAANRNSWEEDEMNSASSLVLTHTESLHINGSWSPNKHRAKNVGGKSLTHTGHSRPRQRIAPHHVKGKKQKMIEKGLMTQNLCNKLSENNTGGTG